MSLLALLPWYLLTSIAVFKEDGVNAVAVCHIPNDNERIDCHPGLNASQAECESRGCCWNDVLSETNPSVPMCYFPRGYSRYVVTGIEKMSYGHRYAVTKAISDGLPAEILSLYVDVIFMSPSTVRIKITDRNNNRFEVPYVHEKEIGPESVEKNLDVSINSDPFWIKITHKITNEVIIDTSIGPLLYSDQFIQFSTRLPSYFVYGLGEHRNPMRLTTSWQRLAFWNRDNAPGIKQNLYGTNPFALFMDDEGQASGWFLMNANAMDAIIQPMPAITFFTTGGIIDLFVYGGTSAEDVIRQHWDVIGPPYFQPLWAMGFHLSRYGYLDIEDLRNVIRRMNTTKFPYDTQWTDIDSMRNKLVFTYDDVKWHGLPQLIEELHAAQKFYTPINDPCIGLNAAPGTYSALDKGLQNDVFIKHPNGEKLIANVWPGDCYMPDFTHPNAAAWWMEEIRVFNNTVPFDGLWIDMNEPASFVTGAIGGCPFNNSLDTPWYVPAVVDNSLMSKTICPSSRQYAGSQYNYHSLYGHIEARLSMNVLNTLSPNKRHFILTRAHYSGTGKYAAHWTGDNFARWDDLYYTIPEIITFNMFGFPFIGSDICGFFENTTEELCMRWMQLGAFVPFMRNHNGNEYVAQDPAIWSEPSREVMKDALILRYRMIPFWYTMHYHASKNMHTVIQPLFYLYPNNEVARYLDTQFLIGRSVLVAPVLNQGVKKLLVYLPPEEARWYTFPDLDLVTTAVNGWNELDVTASTIGLYIRPGSIVPMMTVVNREWNLMQNVPNANLTLIVTLPSNGDNVESALYWDNGLSLPDVGNTYLQILLHEPTITMVPIKNDYNRPMILSEVIIAGFFNENVNKVTINDIPIKFTQTGHKLQLTNLNVNVNTADSVTFRWETN